MKSESKATCQACGRPSIASSVQTLERWRDEEGRKARDGDALARGRYEVLCKVLDIVVPAAVDRWAEGAATTLGEE
jgi:hypothetical protein